MRFYGYRPPVQRLRTEDGSRIERYDTEASDINIALNGNYLFLQGWSQPDGSAWTQILDTTTYQPVTSVQESIWLVPTRHLNGEPIFASSAYINSKDDYHYVIIDPTDMAVMSEWSSTVYLDWLKAP